MNARMQEVCFWRGVVSNGLYQEHMNTDREKLGSSSRLFFTSIQRNGVPSFKHIWELGVIESEKH